jgi:predicted DNA-binding protein (MmcQ/YjbR family)
MKNSPAQPAAAELRRYALSFPEASEEFPWGESAFKVKGKVFVFLYAHADGLNVSLKLPQSNATALDRPFAEPTGYGLGKSGWVTSKFERDERVPVDVLMPWIEESYRAVAPKSLVKVLDAGAGQAVEPASPASPSNVRGAGLRERGSRATAKPAGKKTVARKSPVKKPAAPRARKRT